MDLDDTRGESAHYLDGLIRSPPSHTINHTRLEGHWCKGQSEG